MDLDFKTKVSLSFMKFRHIQDLDMKSNEINNLGDLDHVFFNSRFFLKIATMHGDLLHKYARRPINLVVLFSFNFLKTNRPNIIFSIEDWKHLNLKFLCTFWCINKLFWVYKSNSYKQPLSNRFLFLHARNPEKLFFQTDSHVMKMHFRLIVEFLFLF